MGEVAGFIHGEGDDSQMLVRMPTVLWNDVVDALHQAARPALAALIVQQTGQTGSPRNGYQIILPPGARLVDMDP